MKREFEQLSDLANVIVEAAECEAERTGQMSTMTEHAWILAKEVLAARGPTREELVREWQERVGLNDEQLFADYSTRIREAGIFANVRAVDEREHQFVDRAYVERLRELVALQTS